jgi:hypothetical protein
MTALGKTLVFFNLLFSLVTGGLIVMVFVTRTNWKNGYDLAINDAKVARTEAQAIRSQRDQQVAELTNKVKAALEQVDVQTKLVQTREQEIVNQKQQSEAARKDAAEQTELAKAQSIQVDRLQKERNQKDEYLKALNDQLIKTTNDLANMTQQEKYHHLRGDALEKDLSSLKETYALLNKKFEELSALVTRDQINRGATPNAPRRPSIATTGRVLEADGNFATISLGSDNGIEQNHELDVYRTNEYLGKIIITKSEPHEAVGRFIPSGKGKIIKKDDTVSSGILP